MALTGEHKETICNTFANAFTVSELRQIVEFLPCNVTLEQIAGGLDRNLRDIIFDVVCWLDRNDQIFYLIVKAHDFRPHNRAVHGLFNAAQGWPLEELYRPHPDTPSPAPSPPVVVESGSPTVSGLADTSEVENISGLAMTGLFVLIEPMMASVPTSIYHLLDGEEHPLVKCTVTTIAAYKRVRITSYIEGYSAQAVDTIHTRRNQSPPAVVTQQPTLFLEKADTINKLTRASLNVLAEDLDTGKVEVHKSMPIWLLARNTMPLATYDPTSGKWKDMSRYLGAFVTPNHPRVMRFLRQVAEKHEGTRLVGYQDGADVEAQVKAVFEALKSVAGITYVNSLNTFNPNTGERSQRLRVPSESLEDREANCVDGTVLFASILEALTLNPAIVVLPSHVIVGWETAPSSNKWRYLDTTKLDIRTFEEATQFGTTLAEVMEKQRTVTGDERWFYRWPLRELRGTHGIYPAE